MITTNKLLITLMLVLSGLLLSGCPADKSKASDSTQNVMESASPEAAQAEADAVLKEIENL